MSENWKMQVSIKVDNVHLVNLRAETSEELSGMLKWAVENARAIQLACTEVGGSTKPELVQPRPFQRVAPPAAPVATSREIGPLYLSGVEMKLGPRNGPPFKSPMFVVKWGEGESASTFDRLIGEAASNFWKQATPCFLSLQPSPKNPKYQNLNSVRSAPEA